MITHTEDEGTLLDYAMAIAHERELNVLGHHHDSDGAVLRFRSAVRRALLATGGQAQAVQAADAQDAERWMGIGKAIERASADLPEETEIIVSLEKDAGTVTLIDQDGNEHENFSCDHGFAGVLNEAIDAAIAAQAKQGEK